MTQTEETIQLIRLAVVMEITGLSKTGIYEAISLGEFPKPVKISRRSSAWVRQECLDWVKEKIEARSQEVK